MQDITQVIKYIRSFTFDNDNEIDLRKNSDNNLTYYIMAILPSLNFSTEFSLETETFTSPLTESQKIQIALEASLVILGGIPEDYSYKNPVMSGRMKFGLAKHIQRLEDMLREIKNGKIISSSYDEVRKILESSELLSELTQ